MEYSKVDRRACASRGGRFRSTLQLAQARRQQWGTPPAPAMGRTGGSQRTGRDGRRTGGGGSAAKSVASKLRLMGGEMAGQGGLVN